jgi:hypothetical protein
MSTHPSSSIETRARRLAGRVDREQLLKHAEVLEQEGARAALVFKRAVEIQLENRALESSLALGDALGAAVYDRRPFGRLPSDSIGLEL